MSEVENAQMFWKIVHECLVHFYHLEEPVAAARIRAAQGPMTPAAISRDLTYHSQPLHAAAKIAGVLLPVTDEQLQEYDAMLERTRFESLRSSQTAPVRENKFRDNTDFEHRGLRRTG